MRGKWGAGTWKEESRDIRAEERGQRRTEREREVSQEHIWKKEPRVLGALEKSPGFWKKRVLLPRLPSLFSDHREGSHEGKRRRGREKEKGA